MAEEVIEAWDLFISHASEDKINFVEPLASALSAFGVRVWYDAFTLSIGDSLSRSIDQGLAKSNYGLVVLSPAFVTKRWPEYELRGLVAKEVAKGKTILPVWHNITQQQVLDFSPPLADKVAIRSDNLTPIQIAVKVIEAIRPDIFTRILRRLAHYRFLDGCKIENVDLSKLRPGPIRHENLPKEVISRIRLVRAALLSVYPHSMEFWLDGFKRDSHPSAEVAYWEHLAAVFLEYANMTPTLTYEQAVNVFKIISAFDTDENLDKYSGGFPEGEILKIKNLYSYSQPIYDFDEQLPFADSDGATATSASNASEYDKEHFPVDLPEALVRELLGTKQNTAS